MSRANNSNCNNYYYLNVFHGVDSVVAWIDRQITYVGMYLSAYYYSTVLNFIIIVL